MTLSFPLLDFARNESSDFACNAELFETPYNEALVHQLVITYLNSARAGTKAQKTRTDVSGGGAKPWRQKGTGRARSGSSRSPLWRGGGVVFAARPRGFGQKINKKMYRLGMSSILSQLAREGRIRFYSGLNLETPKTRVLVSKLNDLGVDLVNKQVLLVDNREDVNFHLAARNVPGLKVINLSRLNPYDLVRSDLIFINSELLSVLSCSDL